MECLFCKIIKREIPAFVVYEDDHTVAFLDIHPVTRGHALVVPKAHSAGLHDASRETLEHLVVAIQKVAHAITQALGVQGFNIEQNNGAIAGQLVPHLHFHIIPRHSADGLKHWPGGTYREGEAAEIAGKIRNVLE